jgi:hypothetical protein
MSSIRPASVLLAFLAAGCTPPAPGGTAAAPPPPTDSAFAAIQERGAAPHAMGVDQHTSTHRFDDLPDGGRIELQRDVDDPAGVEQIRRHMRHIAAAFAEGDFGIPGFVHDLTEVPGTRVMAAKRAAIEYRVEDLPRGAAVSIRTRDPEAVAAIHAFLAFQRSDHRAHEHHRH